MSPAVQILDRLRDAGVNVRAEGEKLKMRSDHKPPDALIAAAREHRDELLALLRHEKPASIRVELRPVVRDARHALHVLGKRGVAVTVERDLNGDRWLNLRGGDLDVDLVNAVAEVRADVMLLLSTEGN